MRLRSSAKNSYDICMTNQHRAISFYDLQEFHLMTEEESSSRLCSLNFLAC